jgi:hypothetical protein
MGTSPVKVIAEIHGFSDPGAEPSPWPVGLERVVTAAGTFGCPRSVRMAGRASAADRCMAR